MHLPRRRVEEVRLLDVFPVTKVDLTAAGYVVDHTLDGSAVLLLGLNKKENFETYSKIVTKQCFFSETVINPFFATAIDSLENKLKM